jgi:hypothetical protein
MSMIEKVAKAIADVQLFYRYNDFTHDRVEGFPIEICRHADGDICDPIVIRRFAGTEEEGTYRLYEVVKEFRAIAAIEAMRDPTDAMKDIWWPNVDIRHYQAMIDAALQESKETEG